MSLQEALAIDPAMGPLQRSVYWKLCVLFFFTAFMFFADVFTVNIFPCLEPERVHNFIQNSTESIFSNENDYTWNNVTESVDSSECVEMELFAYGQTMYMIGLLFCAPVGGAFADSYGKQRLLVVSAALQAVTALCSAFSPSAAFHLAARCVAGMACCGINISSFSLGVEWSLPRYRTWPPALLSFFFSLGMMCLAGAAYLCSSVVQLYLSMAIPQLLCFPLYLSIPESPRWLFLNGKMKIVEQYQARSHEDRKNLDQLIDIMGKEEKPSETYNSQKRHCDLVHFKSPTIILRLFVMSYIGLASALTYYGICFNVGNFGVDIYLAQFFSGLSEAPSLLMPLLLGRCGRRPFSIISLFLSGSACLLSVLISKSCDAPALVMGLALMGKLCIQTTTCVTVLYGIELFPTIIRQKCVGVAYLWYRVGCILNAVVALRGGIPLVAMMWYGSGPILGAGLCLLLPETSGRPLPDTVPDCEAQQGGLMPLCCPPVVRKLRL
ncbi:hypothetical protein ANANG_G00001980 [Anguilla anguilla]|uniref:Major facilitator superfamily (MFS) profile domain-containing protein n=1 Tax=Anguilla anguilla TaxID=7936 RepID=A0A9D3MVW3_ANGAN|nr:hypothetical protein ANANG_G00001980 [Anguilla anguilla]